MKNTKVLLFISVCFSFFVILGCESTDNVVPAIPEVKEAPAAPVSESPAVEEKTVETVTEETTPQAEIQEPEPEETPVVAEEIEEPVPAEKIDDEDILQNIVQFEETPLFTEPSVIEAAVKTETVSTDNDDSKITVSEPESQAAVAENKKTEASSVQATVITSAKPAATVNNDSVNTATADIAENKDKQTDNSIIEAETENTEIDIFQNTAVIIPSRSMTVKNNQYVDIVYPGNGWIYIGETEDTTHFKYFGRKLGSADTTFTLRSSKPGKTYLHFYKNDVLTAQYIDDYLEVEVTNASAAPSEKAKAPSYAEYVPPKPVRAVVTIEAEKTEDRSNAEVAKAPVKPSSQTKTAAQKQSSKNDIPAATEDKNVKTNIQNTVTEPAPSPVSTVKAPVENSKPEQQSAEIQKKINIDSSKSLLEQAKASLKAKDYELALAQIQSYLDSANTKIDEALYVQGQILEAESSVKNIRSAIDSYETVTKKYPASRFWQQANKRKIYLQRFYVNIR